MKPRKQDVRTAVMSRRKTVAMIDAKTAARAARCKDWMMMSD